jgi:thioredoxin-related protein
MNKAVGILLTALMLLVAPIAGAVELGEDGLHKQPWFSITFKDIREDMQAARDEGKRLAIIIEQRGCTYCRKLHEEVFSDSEVSDYIKANFKVVQYNMFGDEEVTDLDGEVLREKQAVRKWGMLFTPTIAFLSEDIPESGSLTQATVSVMPGAFGKHTVLNMFRWVREKGYEGDEHFQKYHARKIDELRAKGLLKTN